MPMHDLTTIKMIVSDVDGTLVDSHRELPSVNSDALKKAHQQGIMIVIATGRPIDGILPDIIKWQLEDTVDYIVANNGADIYHVSDGKTTHLHFIPSNSALTLLDHYQDHDVAICIYDGQTLLTNTINEDYVKRSNYAHLTMRCVDLRPYLTQDLPKLLMIASCDILDAIESDYVDHPIDPIKLVHCESNLIEVLHKDLSKVSGIDTIARAHGIDMDQIISFGDTTNDLEMIQVYHGVAVDNADPRIKSASAYTTASNDQGGVGRFILERIIK